MLYQNDTTRIAQAWQGQLEESLEAGEMPWLEGGLSRQTIAHLPMLLALEQLARQRTDVTTPGLLLGGDGIGWTAALMSQAAAQTGGGSPALTLFYGGADQASYMALLATLPGPSAHTRQQRATGLPVGMQAQLLPTSQPGAIPPWSSLPFVLAEQAASHPHGRAGDAEAWLPWLPWLPWLTILVVIGLIITALFV
ncbi:MAG: hypothetical protein DYG89_32420 [Caldilinea sp. CFX5]|nr:hypothetical protein [Caldilinea sp. CFX5]